jgi:hypothetical protein
VSVPARLDRQIRAYLARRAAGLSAAVRCYPTPIARCDEQLPALIEARREVLQLLEEGDATLAAAFAAAAARWDDPAARAIAARAAARLDP